MLLGLFLAWESFGGVGFWWVFCKLNTTPSIHRPASNKDKLDQGLSGACLGLVLGGYGWGSTGLYKQQFQNYLAPRSTPEDPST